MHKSNKCSWINQLIKSKVLSGLPVTRYNTQIQMLHKFKPVNRTKHSYCKMNSGCLFLSIFLIRNWNQSLTVRDLNHLNILTLLRTLPFIQLVRGVFKEVRSSFFGLYLYVTSTLKMLLYILQPYWIKLVKENLNIYRV